MQRQEHRRPHQVVVDPPLVERGDPRHRRPSVAMTALHGHRLRAAGQLHPATLPAAPGHEVGAEIVRRELVELGMEARAVVALGVVLGDELPVRADVVVDPLRRTEAAEVEAAQVLDEVAELIGQRGRVGIEVEEDEPLPDLAAHADEAVRVEAEVLEAVRVLRADEAAVEVVDPRVVRTLETDHLAALVFGHGRAAVAAHVVERPQDVVPTPDHDQLVVVDLGQEVLPGSGASSARPTGIQSRRRS